MKTPALKIPAQIFVTAKAITEYVFPDPTNYRNRLEEVHNFGFLHPHQPGTKVDSKRKDTQLQWAYGMSHESFMEWRSSNRPLYIRQYDHSLRRGIEVPVPFELTPRVWDNFPTTGFQIIDTVSRYRGNKLFKVMDPRGLEFEITAKSLFHIICDGEIKSGEIISPCVWKANKDLRVWREE